MSTPKTLLGGEDVHAIVIDSGSWAVRIGSAGDDSPRSIIPSAVGLKPSSADVTMTDVNNATAIAPSNSNNNKLIAGDTIMTAPHLLHDIQPVYTYDSTTGSAHVSNWDGLESVWRAGLRALHLQTVSASAPLMLVEPSRMWDDNERARALQHAFEGLGVPAAYIGRGAAMAAFSAARSTACVVDVGAQGASVVPVIDGYVLKKTTRRGTIGGMALSQKLQEWTERCLVERPGYDGRERRQNGNAASGSPGKRARSPDEVQYLRAHHELRRQRIYSEEGGGGSGEGNGRAEGEENNNNDSNGGKNSGTAVRRYKVTDIADHSKYTETHRQFYRLRLVDDIKAALLNVDPAKPSSDKDENGKNEGNGNGETGTNGDNNGKNGANSSNDASNNNNKKGDSSTSNDNNNDDKSKETGNNAATAKQQQASPEGQERSYTLPDGNILKLSEKNGREIGNLLFSSSTSPSSSLVDLVLSSVSACDTDNRRDLFGGVVVVGGTTLLPGCVERLTRQLALDVPQTYKLKLHAAANTTERTSAGWIGGSIVASLGTFQQAWISKAEYDELGANNALRKCP